MTATATAQLPALRPIDRLSIDRISEQGHQSGVPLMLKIPDELGLDEFFSRPAELLPHLSRPLPGMTLLYIVNDSGSIFTTGLIRFATVTSIDIHEIGPRVQMPAP